MRTKTIGIAAGLVLAVVVAATAVAATTGTGPVAKLFAANHAQRRAEYARELAQKLGVPESRVSQAMSQIQSERQEAQLNKRAGLLAQQLHVSQADAKRALEQARSQFGRGKANGMRPNGGRPNGGGPGPVVRSIANSLHKSPTEVAQALKAVRKQMLEQRLSQAVAAGTITQQQADQLRQRIESGTWGRGGHRGWRGLGAPDRDNTPAAPTGGGA